MAVTWPYESSVPIEPGYADLTVAAPILPFLNATESAILTSNGVVLEGRGLLIGVPGITGTQSLDAAAPGLAVVGAGTYGGASVQIGWTWGHGVFFEFGTGWPGLGFGVLNYEVKGQVGR
jgi:hypothetical protein